MQDRRLSGAVSGTLDKDFLRSALREDYGTRRPARPDCVDPRDHRFKIKQNSGHVSNTERSVVVTE